MGGGVSRRASDLKELPDKHLGPVVAVCHIAYPDLGVGRVEDVGPVAAGVHPGVHHRLSGPLAVGDVFSGGASTYTQTIYKAVFAKIAAAPDAFYADYQNLAKFFDLSDHWYLGENGVVIFFDPFQIAGYDKGIVEFVLPYDEYSSDLKINPLYMG